VCFKKKIFLLHYTLQRDPESTEYRYTIALLTDDFVLQNSL